MLQDVKEINQLLAERESVGELWHQLENRIAVGEVTSLSAEDRNGTVGMRTTITLRVPRHVIAAMKVECERRRDEITGILVRNYGIKDA